MFGHIGTTWLLGAVATPAFIPPPLPPSPVRHGKHIVQPNGCVPTMASGENSRRFGVPPCGTDRFAFPAANPDELVIACHEKLICVDVKAVLTRKNEYKAGSVSVVDQRGRTRYDGVVNVPAQIVEDPLTCITGITVNDLARGTPLNKVQATVKAICSRGTVLVGQGIARDIQWMGMTKGVDYARSVNIANHFRVWHSERHNWASFSLEHLAYGLLDDEDSSMDDAEVSMELFTEYLWDEEDKLREARKKMFTMFCQGRFPE